MSFIQSLPEKLQLKEERNLLIQGLPSSIEKQFVKFSFAKNVTPLLKSRKIDFALVFAISQQQLRNILRDVIPVLRDNAKFWIAFPKVTSKIVSDLSRDCHWEFLTEAGFAGEKAIDLDHVWAAMQFCRVETELVLAGDEEEEMVKPVRGIETPAGFQSVLNKNKKAAACYEALPSSHKKEYINWIASAKKEETQLRRVEKAVEMLVSGKSFSSAKN
jgi:hypothetical protein